MWPKMFLANQIARFFNQSQDSKTCCVSVQQFSQKWLIRFLWFLAQFKYWKTEKTFFSRKIHFCPNLGKKGPEWLQNRFFLFFEKFYHLSFLGNNRKWKLILFLIFQQHIWQNFGSRVMGQKCCKPIKLQDFLKCNIIRKKWMMKFIFCMQTNIEVFCKVIPSIWVSVTRHALSTQNKFAYLCNILIAAWGIKLIFCLQINTNVFYKMIVSLWVCIDRRTQSTKNSQFTISLQNLKENMKD